MYSILSYHMHNDIIIMMLKLKAEINHYIYYAVIQHYLK